MPEKQTRNCNYGNGDEEPANWNAEEIQQSISQRPDKSGNTPEEEDSAHYMPEKLIKPELQLPINQNSTRKECHPKRNLD